MLADSRTPAVVTWYRTSMNFQKFLGLLVASASLLGCSSATTGAGDAGVSVGGQWVQLNTGLPPNAVVVSLASQGTKLYALTNEGSNNFYLSTNSGASWARATGDMKIPGVNDPVAVSAFALSGTTIYAGAGLLFSSTNDGQNWTVVDNTRGNPVVYTMVAAFGTDVFAGTFGGVLVSHDSGATWASAQTNDGTGHDTAWVDGVPSTMTLFGTRYMTGVSLGQSAWASTDHGDHWATANAGLPPGASGAGRASITAFAVHGTTLLAGAGGHGIYQSNATVSAWEEANSGFLTPNDPLGPVNAYVFAVSGSSIFAGTDSGVYVSTDNAATWSKLDRADLPDFTAVYSMTVMGSNLYIGTYTSGVWRHAL